MLRNQCRTLRETDSKSSSEEDFSGLACREKMPRTFFTIGIARGAWQCGLSIPEGSQSRFKVIFNDYKPFL
jgi:hypothetical protein